MPRPSVVSPRHAELVALIEARKSATAIARIMKLPQSTVNGYLRRNKLKAIGRYNRERGNSRRTHPAASRSFTVLSLLFHDPEQRDTDVAEQVGVTSEYCGQVRLWMETNGVVKS
jgi:hypothetical protein